jgi:MFS family permease
MSALPLEHLDIEAPGPPRSLRRNRDFLLLWSGQIVSSVGSQLSMLAFPLLVLSVTHSPAETGLLGGLRSLPFLLFTLPVGALADRWDRKLLMVVADAGRALALGSVPVALAAGRLTLGQLALVSLVEGALFTVYNVTESAALPQVVAREQLPQAVSLSQTTDSLALLAGPSLSGALYSVSRGLPFLADALSYAVSVVSLLFLRTELQQERTGDRGSMWQEIREGFGWLWHHPLVRFLALLAGGLNLFSFGYPLLLIVRAQSLHANPFTVGLLFASGGVGAALGALLAAPLQRRFTFGQVMIGATWVWVLTWPPFAWAPTVPLLGVANAMGWFIVPIFMASHYSFRLTFVPDALLGRVNSVFKLIAFGVEPFALALAGLLLQLFGGVTAVLLIFAPQLVLAVVATRNPHLRSAPTLRELAGTKHPL